MKERANTHQKERRVMAYFRYIPKKVKEGFFAISHLLKSQAFFTRQNLNYQKSSLENEGIAATRGEAKQDFGGSGVPEGSEERRSPRYYQI